MRRDPKTAAERLVRASAANVRSAEFDRNVAILQMRDAGASLREIAEAAGLSHSGVAKILARGQSVPL